MSEKIELEAGRDFSDIMSDTFVLVRQNFSPLIKAYFVICGLFLLTCIIISALYNLNSAEPTLSFLYGFITIVFGIFIIRIPYVVCVLGDVLLTKQSMKL